VIQRASLYFDEHFVCFDGWRGDVNVFEYVRFAVFIEDYSFHGFISLSLWRGWERGPDLR
jgi:hypothetical protein